MSLLISAFQSYELCCGSSVDNVHVLLGQVGPQLHPATNFTTLAFTVTLVNLARSLTWLRVRGAGGGGRRYGEISWGKASILVSGLTIISNWLPYTWTSSVHTPPMLWTVLLRIWMQVDPVSGAQS